MPMPMVPGGSYGVGCLFMGERPLFTEARMPEDGDTPLYLISISHATALSPCPACASSSSSVIDSLGVERTSACCLATSL